LKQDLSDPEYKLNLRITPPLYTVNRRRCCEPAQLVDHPFTETWKGRKAKMAVAVALLGMVGVSGWALTAMIVLGESLWRWVKQDSAS